MEVIMCGKLTAESTSETGDTEKTIGQLWAALDRISMDLAILTESCRDITKKYKEAKNENIMRL